jgi:hypothetical protein
LGSRLQRKCEGKVLSAERMRASLGNVLDIVPDFFTLRNLA